MQYRLQNTITKLIVCNEVFPSATADGKADLMFSLEIRCSLVFRVDFAFEGPTVLTCS